MLLSLHLPPLFHLSGNFVAHLSDQLKQQIHSADPSSKIRQLTVKSPHSAEDLFIDLGRYGITIASVLLETNVLFNKSWVGMASQHKRARHPS